MARTLVLFELEPSDAADMPNGTNSSLAFSLLLFLEYINRCCIHVPYIHSSASAIRHLPHPHSLPHFLVRMNHATYISTLVETCHLEPTASHVLFMSCS
jgi:hypothetical protein